MEKSIFPKLAFEALEKAAEKYKGDNNTFSNESLEILHSYFGDAFIQATELLDYCKIDEYALADKLRKIYKVSTSKHQHTIFDCINFCQCNNFQTKVLDSRTSITCKHVIAVALGKIMGKIREETISDNLFEELLNEQANSLAESQDFN